MERTPIFDFQVIKVSAFAYITSILSTCIFGPILEELIFRGIIYTKLKESFNKSTAIFLVSLLCTFIVFFHLEGRRINRSSSLCLLRSCQDCYLQLQHLH